ncbi:hypothetical protein Fmac_025402 [Flemingia macrophylla]|uniref:Uncharacterized protein n=1 Tax=Flemingia macrophylla TaxID=520843 RepID=A0ABD1LS68_9FABA
MSVEEERAFDEGGRGKFASIMLELVEKAPRVLEEFCNLGTRHEGPRSKRRRGTRAPHVSLIQ